MSRIIRHLPMFEMEQPLSFETLQSMYQSAACGEWSFHLRLFYPRRKTPQYPPNKALGGPQIQSRGFVQEKPSCLASNCTPNPQTLCRYPNHCTDYITLLRSRRLCNILGPCVKRWAMLHHEMHGQLL